MSVCNKLHFATIVQHPRKKKYMRGNNMPFMKKILAKIQKEIVNKSLKIRLKGTLMQISKSVNIFVFI